jgi:hypothetical protein
VACPYELPSLQKSVVEEINNKVGENITGPRKGPMQLSQPSNPSFATDQRHLQNRRN